MKTIPLTQGYIALVDDADYERVMAVGKWHVVVTRRGVYARNNKGKRGRRYMHRFILGVTDPTQEVDHRNGYGMDNRRENLRLATRSQNGANRRKTARKTSSRFRGVFWCKGKEQWQATVKLHGKQIILGYFSDEKDAARAYDVAAVEHHGEFANLNFNRHGAPRF